MKILKKICYVIVTICILFVQVAVPVKQNKVEAKATTLRQMKEELAQLEAKLENNKKEQASSQAGIDSSKRKIEQISKDRVSMEKEIEDLSEEIATLNKEIVSMNEDIKDILNYYQLSSTGNSSALEYVFDSSDYTEFIYRMAITDQLSQYNDETIKSYNKKISDNEDKKVKLADKQTELNKTEAELEEYIEAEKEKLSESLEGAVSLEDEIESLKKTVYTYEVTYKCKLDETIDECTADKLPAGSTLYRPVVVGRVSSNFGGRTYKLNGRWTSDFHYGLDFSGNHGDPVYSAGNGKVAAIFRKQSCGGNMVYINHLINGKKYTTAYYHLGSVTVNVNQTVTYNTQIGTRGGNPSIETWDHCSTGSHTHFSVSTGNWGNEFSSYSGFIARNIDPRKVVNAPALGGSFSGRNIKY